jgi:hypothetical protein
MAQVILFSLNDQNALQEEWTEEWTGEFTDFVVANDLEVEEALGIGTELGETGVARMGGGAAPIFELRFAKVER